MIIQNKLNSNKPSLEQPLRIVKGWRTLKYIKNDDEPGMRYRYDRIPNVSEKQYYIYTALRILPWLLAGGFIISKFI